MDDADGTASEDPRIHRSPGDTDVDLTDATLALHDWEAEEDRRREEPSATVNLSRASR